MRFKKPLSVLAAAMTIGLSLVPDQAIAGLFNNRVTNPFTFCRAPRPCSLCEPWRTIWEEICAGQKEAGKGGGESSATPIIETLDAEGNLAYVRTVNGWTIRSNNRADIEDESLQGGRSGAGAGVEVIDGPIPELQSRQQRQVEQ